MSTVNKTVNTEAEYMHTFALIISPLVIDQWIKLFIQHTSTLVLLNSVDQYHYTNMACTYILYKQLQDILREHEPPVFELICTGTFYSQFSNRASCTQVRDFLYRGVGIWHLHSKLSCINLKNDPQNGLFKHFMVHYFQRIHQEPITHQCVCIIAAGSWEPVVAGEYLMRE